MNIPPHSNSFFSNKSYHIRSNRNNSVLGLVLSERCNFVPRVKGLGLGVRVRVLGTRLRALDNFVGFSGDHRHSTLLPLTKMLISSLPKLPKGAQCCKRNSLLFE